MQSFKHYLLNEFLNVKPVENEAMLTLQKIIDMADDGHIDYEPNKITINVGKLIKNKKYNGLTMFILTGTGSPKIGRHADDDTHAIFLYAKRLPQRHQIDTFLSDQERSANFKKLFSKFFNDAVFDNTDDNEDSQYEKTNNLNDRKSFEKSYVELVNKLNETLTHYNSAKKDLDDKVEKASEDLGHKEILKLSLTKIKKDILGSSLSEFKTKAIELYGKENYKLLNKEFKSKLDSRLTDYFESKIN
jgi:hypothetical protein